MGWLCSPKLRERREEVASEDRNLHCRVVDRYRGWWQGSDVRTAVVETLPPSRLITKIVDETQFGGTWTFEVVPTPSGSRLTITERGEIYNVVFRALARYAFGYTGTMDSFLEAARNKLNKDSD